jgi:REP element-mobilizing transposase RayT
MRRSSSTLSGDDLPQRRSIRLGAHDYRAGGAYFVTVCTLRRRRLFGRIAGGVLRPSAAGEIVAEEWERTAVLRSGVALDALVVMPDHVHGILVLEPGSLAEPSGRTLAGGSVGAIVAQFKAACARRINLARATPGAAVWQRGYYERIVRGPDALPRIRGYIIDNPHRWWLDHGPEATPRTPPTAP